MFKKFRSTKGSTVNVPFILLVLVVGELAYTKAEHIVIDLFCILVIAIILDTCYFLCSKDKIEIAIETSKVKIQKGENLELFIQLKNKSFLPSIYLHMYPSEGYRLLLKEKRSYCTFLGGIGTQEIRVIYEAALSGKQNVGLAKVFIKDYLGLYKKELLVPELIKVKVIPEIWENIDSEAFLGAGLEEGVGINSHTPINQDLQGEVAEELVPYKEGDSPRLVHWKIFARKDQLLVRQREDSGQGGENLLVILNPVGSKVSEVQLQYQLQDRCLTVSLSLIHQLLRRGYEVTFMYYHKGSWIKAELKENRALQYLREKLAGYEHLQAISNRSYESILSSFTRSINRGAIGQLIVTEDADESLSYYLKKKNRNLKESKIIYVGRKINLIKRLDTEIWGVEGEYTFKKG